MPEKIFFLTGLALIVIVGVIWLILQPRDPQVADLAQLEAQINQVEAPQTLESTLEGSASEPAIAP